jgi:hypothetical protein
MRKKHGRTRARKPGLFRAFLLPPKGFFRFFSTGTAVEEKADLCYTQFVKKNEERL